MPARPPRRSSTFWLGVIDAPPLTVHVSVWTGGPWWCAVPGERHGAADHVVELVADAARIVQPSR